MEWLRPVFKICPWQAALLGFLLLLGSLSSQSIDLEEARTWECLRATDAGDFFVNFSSHPRSADEMVPGLFCSWVWTRFAGLSEAGMRGINLLWAGVALLALARVGTLVSIGWLPLLFALQPFLWYSMDKSQNTVMQMAGGSLLLLGVVSVLACKKFSGAGVFYLSAGTLVTCGASLLGLVVVLAVATGLLFHHLWGRMEMTRPARVWVLLTAGVLLLLAGYWLAVLWRGEGPLKLWPVTPLNLAYILYEALGFQGLGPGKVALQAIAAGDPGLPRILPFLPLLLLLAASYGAVFFSAYKGWLTRPFERIPASHPHLHSWCAGVGVPAVAIALAFLFSIATGFVFWGRHLAGAFPFWVLALAFTMHWSGQGLWRRWGRMGCIGLWSLLTASSLLVRLAPHQGHEDYRLAAREAQKFIAQGSVIWWFADRSTADYYHLPLITPQDPVAGGGAVFMANESAPASAAPDAIFLSRPENFDRSGLANRAVRSMKPHPSPPIHGFQIWVQNKPLDKK
jgi:hypothetical protein